MESQQERVELQIGFKKNKEKKWTKQEIIGFIIPAIVVHVVVVKINMGSAFKFHWTNSKTMKDLLDQTCGDNHC